QFPRPNVFRCFAVDPNTKVLRNVLVTRWRRHRLEACRVVVQQSDVIETHAPSLGLTMDGFVPELPQFPKTTMVRGRESRILTKDAYHLVDAKWPTGSLCMAIGDADQLTLKGDPRHHELAEDVGDLRHGRDKLHAEEVLEE